MAAIWSSTMAAIWSSTMAAIWSSTMAAIWPSNERVKGPKYKYALKIFVIIIFDYW
jgi:hypothetical protein